jgi:hypothetical protein
MGIGVVFLLAFAALPLRDRRKVIALFVTTPAA